MKKLILLFALVQNLNAQTLLTQNYVYDATTNFANPERGMARLWDIDASFTQTNLQNYHNGANEKVTLLWRVYYLNAFYNTDVISASYLTKITNELQLCRANGFKMIMRFAYSNGTTAANGKYNSEPDLARIQAHLNQLKPIIIQNKDVITNFQAGFVGYWGEWFYTDNFSFANNVPNYPKRKQLMDTIFESFTDSTRMVALRTPRYKTNMYSLNYATGAITADESFRNTYKAKIGFSNECMFSSYEDGGTYEYADSVAAKNYLANDTKYVIMGGEHCDSGYLNPTKNNCSNTVNELRNLHFSYVNAGGDSYKTGILQWITQGCYPEIVKNLGYRFHLEQLQYPAQIKQGDSLNILLKFKNYGYAGIYNPRKIVLKLRNKSTNQITDFVFSADARKILPLGSESKTISMKFKTPNNFQACDYDLLLQLPDPFASLNTASNAPYYSIRLATKNSSNLDLWDSSTGVHNLGTVLKVCPTTIESIGSGNWTSPNTWQCGCIPTATDKVIIKSGHKVVVASGTPKIEIGNILIEYGAGVDVQSGFLSVPKN